MYNYRNIAPDLYWIGGNDRRLPLFENVYPVPRGVSYNSYLLLGEKTVLLDAVDKAVEDVFLENLAQLLGGRRLDYIVVHHMEPDHAATLNDVLLRWPGAEIVCTAQAARMFGQFFTEQPAFRIVKEGDTLVSGEHTLTFYTAAMVHWPEVMVSYDSLTRALFCADAFGTFGALGGSLWADELDFEHAFLPDARRYYTNIVGKYGAQVQALLKKAAALDIRYLFPLHGPLWRENLGWYIEKYQRWSTYTPEDQAVMVAYASVYGHTENAAEIFASRLAENGVRDVRLFDVSTVHPSEIVSEAFRCSHLAFFSTTYNMGVFCNMQTVLDDLAAHNLRGRTVAVVENGSWAPAAGNLIRAQLAKMNDMTVLDTGVTIRSAVREPERAQLCALADALSATMALPVRPAAGPIENPAMFKLSYGLFVLTAREGEKDNGCIVNSVLQLTDNPKRLVLCVNKQNYTNGMIARTGLFNLSVLSEEVPFKVFQHFGFQSGRDVDKFAACPTETRAANGLRYLPKYCNAVLSARVVAQTDYGTHTLFVAEVTEARVLSAAPSCTYAYYFAHIKPAPQPKPADAPKKKRWVCKICGYVYEGDELPADFICPLCKHPASDFELVEG